MADRQRANVQRSSQTSGKGGKHNDFSFCENVFLLLLKIVKFHYNFLHLSFTSLVYIQNITALSVSLSRPIKLSISTQEKQ